MFRKLIPAAALLSVGAIALAAPAQAAQQPGSDSAQRPAATATAPAQQNGKQTPKAKQQDSEAVKKAKALCLSTGQKDAALAVELARYTRATKPGTLRVQAAKAKSKTEKARLLKLAADRDAKIKDIKKQRAALAKTLQWCASQGYATR